MRLTAIDVAEEITDLDLRRNQEQALDAIVQLSWMQMNVPSLTPKQRLALDLSINLMASLVGRVDLPDHVPPPIPFQLRLVGGRDAA